MDILIFIISFAFLFKPSKIEWPIVGMLILANDYLGLGNFFRNNNLNYYEPKDLGWVLMVLLLVVSVNRYKYEKKAEQVQKLNNYIKGFLGYLLLTILIDYIWNGIDMWSIARTSRHWLMLFMYIPLMRIPQINLEAVIRIIYKLTILVSAIIVYEYLANVHYFTGGGVVSSDGVVRGALPSTYALLYVLLVAMGYGNHKKIVRYLIVTLLAFSLLLSATKSIALGLFLGFVVLSFLKSKSFFATIPKILGVSIAALIVIIMLPSLRTRLIQGSSSFGDLDDGSTTFRMLLAEERYHYIANDPVTYIFGIGNVTEDNFKGNFITGHINADGVQAQLDTSDITWALTFLRLGILGTILWAGISLMFSWCFIKRRENIFSIPLISYLILNLFVISLASTSVYIASYWVIPLVCLNIVYSDDKIKE